MKQGIIIGAGIGGLTTAIALAQKGIKTTIYEQANELTDIGAGIGIAPNGLKVYQQLGIAQEIINAGKELKQIKIVDLKQNTISEIDCIKAEAKHHFKTVALHRAALQTILKKYIKKDEIILGKRFASYSQTKDGVTVAFEDASNAEADFLILADGIKSKGRLQLNGNLNLRYSGQTCWRFVADFNFPTSEDGNMYEVWSNKKGLRVGYSQINSRQIYVFITNYEKAGNKDNPIFIKQDLLKLCAEFPEIVEQMITAAEADKIIRSDLFDFKPIKKWTDKRVALLGDAAHATTPNLGQGACQAIEDGFVLAEQLAAMENIEEALLNYQAKRMAKATFITNTSWQLAQITNTSGLIKSLLQTIIKMTPKFISEKQVDKIYVVDY